MQTRRPSSCNAKLPLQGGIDPRQVGYVHNADAIAPVLGLCSRQHVGHGVMPDTIDEHGRPVRLARLRALHKRHEKPLGF